MKAILSPVSVFASGLLFAAGLALSGMVEPQKVLGFLDVTGDWDPSLAFVMGGAIAVHVLAYRWTLLRPMPFFSAIPFARNLRREIDGSLVAGAVLFGIGWGLAGICPGPALVAAASGTATAFPFLGAMFAGMLLYRLWRVVQQRVAAARLAADG